MTAGFFMKNIKVCALLCSCLLAFGGCAASSSTGSTDPTASGKAEAASSAEAKSDVQVKLDETAKKLAAMAGRTVVPNKSKPKVARMGKQYVATYVDVDLESVRTTMRPGQSAKVPYVGIVEYLENTYECTGATRAEAQSLKNCTASKSRQVKELISYDGKKWQY